MIYAYVNANKANTTEGRQKDEIKEFLVLNGVEPNEVKFYSEPKYDTVNTFRQQYRNIKRRLVYGDTLVVTDLNKLGCDVTSAVKEIESLKNRGVHIVSLDSINY